MKSIVFHSPEYDPMDKTCATHIQRAISNKPRLFILHRMRETVRTVPGIREDMEIQP